MCYTSCVKPVTFGPGDTIGLIAPSSSLKKPQALDEAVGYIEQWGYRVKVGLSCGKRYGYLSGDDETRAGDINAMFRDPEVKAVVCLNGGYGATRLLDRIDYGAIAANPKLLVGYSDITALHLALYAKCALCTVHAPMPAYGVDEASVKSLNECLSGATVGCALVNPNASRLVCVNPGVAEAPLIGGNLSLIASLTGTGYMPDVAGKLLLIEEVDEYTYAVDRMLTQLRLAGAFEKCAGVVFGSFSKCESEYPDRALSIERIISDVVAPCGKPIISALEIGHVKPTLSLALGIRYHLDAAKGEIIPLERVFSD